MRLPFLFLNLALACRPSLMGEAFRFEKLPGDSLAEPATLAFQSRDGAVYITQLTGGTFRLSADSSKWEGQEQGRVSSLMPDYLKDSQLGGDGTFVYEFTAKGLERLTLPPPVFVEFGSQAMAALIGRDTRGAFWAAITNPSGTTLYLAHLDAGASEWKSTKVGLATPKYSYTPHVFTRDGRLVWRSAKGGVFEAQLSEATVAERVACTHELFRPTSPDYTPCLEDTHVFAARDGSAWVLNPHREAWRLGNAGTVTKVIAAELPRFAVKNPDGTNRYSPGVPQFYDDPVGRVWLWFRWGNNDGDDLGYLYVADPKQGSAWHFVRDDLPRNSSLFPDGRTPLVSNGSLDTGLLLYRIFD